MVYFAMPSSPHLCHRAWTSCPPHSEATSLGFPPFTAPCPPLSSLPPASTTGINHGHNGRQPLLCSDHQRQHLRTPFADATQSALSAKAKDSLQPLLRTSLAVTTTSALANHLRWDWWCATATCLRAVDAAAVLALAGRCPNRESVS